tara:strand:- start:1736 stop:2323 length:588 start_codon:yes stop_codon:yes gene_type:complete
MADLTLRETKGSPLTFGEMDGNLTNLNNDKQEIIPNLTTDTSIDVTLDKFSFYDNATSTTRSIVSGDVTPFVERTLIIKCVADDKGPTAGNGITHVTIPSPLNTRKLQNAEAHVYTVGTAGTITTVQLHNLTDAADMLSTPITIDLNENDSSTAATPHVIGTERTVQTGDVIRVDVDYVATNTLGLELRMIFGTV